MILTPTERMLAWRYLRARRAEGFISLISWFAIIGIMLGVATLIVVTSLMNGVRHEMADKFIGIDGHATVMVRGRAFTDYEAVLAQLRQMPGVQSVSPRINGQVMVTAHGQAMGAQAMALPADDLAARDILTHHITAGALADVGAEQGVALGESLAYRLNVNLGDTITLISPQGRATIAGFIPRMKTYPVVALFKLGMHAFDGGLVVMPFAEAQTYFMLREGEAGAVSALDVMVSELDDASRIAQAAQKALGYSEFRVFDWQQANAQVFSALTTQRNVLMMILALIVLVAAFNIISSLVMLVKEKQRDIAVLRTMGLSRAGVMRVFLAAGTLVGVAGTLAGLGLGLLLAAYLEPLHQLIERLVGREILVDGVYFLSTLPTQTDPREVAVILVVALLLSFLSALYPARRAARLDPAEVLRDG